MASRWEYFDHEADIGVRGIGATKSEAFAAAAAALAALVTPPDTVKPTTTRHIVCKSRDSEQLLVAWLNAVIYEMSSENVVFNRFKVELGEKGLTGTAFGEALDPARHLPQVEPKGATFTMASVCQDETGAWIAQCVIDV